MKSYLLVLAALIGSSEAIDLSKMKKNTYSDGPHASVPLPNVCDEGKNAGREYMHPIDQGGISPASLYGPRDDGAEKTCTEGENPNNHFHAWEEGITTVKS